MARLIDADALEFAPDENGIANGVLIWGGRTGGKTMTTVLSALKKMIDNAPTVDAVEVVRCKDCKHCYEATFSSTGYRCKVWGVYDTDCEVTPEHYCSYGERKDND